MNSNDVSAEAGKGIPKLRFPEFLGQPLHNVQLGDVTDEASTRNGGKLAAASVMGVRKEGGIVPMEERLVAGDISRYKLVRNDWFAYNPMRLNIGSIARWQGDDEILVSPDYVVFRCSSRAEPTPIIPEYLDHFRSSRQWDAFTNESGDGGVRIRIYYRDLARMRLLLPSAIEQHKIADCLSSIDALIAAEADKLEALKKHKRGLMQQFFPAPGETTPRLRFPEFQGAGDWEEQALGNLLEFPPNYGANAPSAPYSPDLPTYLRITDISEDGRFIRESRMSVEVEATPDNSMQAGDIALTRTGASVGKSYLHKEAEGPLVFAGFLIRIRPNSNLIIPEFVSQFFNSYRYWSWVEKTSTRSGQPGLNSTEFSALLIPLPKNNQGKGIQEQRRIADSLSSIDALIVSQSDRINAIKTHKQGLMHQLFPVASEVQV
ncbi:hypothetical protein C7W88_03010 [Novosphingobium sp. THN1]|uniref:restriction endonuclease subunit S n=2 Tax=Sphingomonadaceae TaxID=41297 RepID=UPI000E4E7CBE|nr:restriction endonuclease subunit S [Novosphingobium sp. THN1]AXU18236.1 hypothetical protein C7W88_03010 [Novosphingobium sp. THN1]